MIDENEGVATDDNTNVQILKPKPVNFQPVEALERDSKGRIDVHSWFPTIQGEGPFTGKSAVFIRLAGCNLMCPYCDTDYTSQRTLMDPSRLVKEVQAMADARAFVVITGGEPFRQNIVPLVRMLLNTGYIVQIETNGTMTLPDMPYSSTRLFICCSPKTLKVHPSIMHWSSYYKYIIDADFIDKDDGLPTSVLGLDLRPARPWVVRSPKNGGKDVWVQPADMGDLIANERNLQAAVESCFKFGYRISIQLHKILGLP